jgi:hypothetical protein
MKIRFKVFFGSTALVFLLFAAPADLARAAGLIDTGLEAFLAADFTSHPSDAITNPWWTMAPGTNALYFAEEEGECAWNLVEVLALTTDHFAADYAGTDARVILDREWKDEDCRYDAFAEVWANLGPEETTYDWYAQDADQNIWYLGEDTWDGDSGGSFIAGCDGAEAGIVMLGNPAKGDSYQQEFYAGEAEDWGKVLNFVPIDELNCLKIKEWNPLDPGHVEHKYYCSDGAAGQLVLIEELKGKTVIVDMLDTNVAAPPPPAAPPSPIPDC